MVWPMEELSKCSCPSFPLGMAWQPLPMEAQAPSAAGRGKAQDSFDSLLQAPSGDGALGAREGTVLGRTEAQQLLSGADRDAASPRAAVGMSRARQRRRQRETRSNNTVPHVSRAACLAHPLG